jgi:glutathione S-transferase
MEADPMNLYYSPGACSLASHIALNEAGLNFDLTRVDLKSHTTADGADYRQINPKGYVPALQFDDGSLLTENVAILTWITDQATDDLMPPGDFGRYRLLETLAHISTELHKAFKPFFNPKATAQDRDAARTAVTRHLDLISGNLPGDYLFGEKVTAADAYLLVMLIWAKKQGIGIPAGLKGYFGRMQARPAVSLALQQEGLEKLAA